MMKLNKLRNRLDYFQGTDIEGNISSKCFCTQNTERISSYSHRHAFPNFNCSQTMGCCCSQASTFRNCSVKSCACAQQTVKNNLCEFNCQNNELESTLRRINLADYLSSKRVNLNLTQRLEQENKSKFRLVKKYSSPWHQNKGMREWYVSNVMMKRRQNSLSSEKHNMKRSLRTSKDSNKSGLKDSCVFKEKQNIHNSQPLITYNPKNQNNENICMTESQRTNKLEENLLLDHQNKSDMNSFDNCEVSIPTEIHKDEEIHKTINIKIPQNNGFNFQGEKKRTATINLENLFLNHILQNKENIDDSRKNINPQVSQRKEFNKWIEDHQIDNGLVQDSVDDSQQSYSNQIAEERETDEEIINRIDQTTYRSKGNFASIQHEFQPDLTDSCPSTRRNNNEDSQKGAMAISKMNFNQNSFNKNSELLVSQALKAMNLNVSSSFSK